MSCGDVRACRTTMRPALTNGDKRFVLYMLNCTATAFDFPCLAEAFLEAPGGAVAVLGASRAAFALPSRNYNRDFFEAAVSERLRSIWARPSSQSRLPQTPNAWFDTADHYTHLLYNFLGDPEMVMHTCALGDDGRDLSARASALGAHERHRARHGGRRAARTAPSSACRRAPRSTSSARRTGAASRHPPVPRRERRRRAGDGERPEHDDATWARISAHGWRAPTSAPRVVSDRRRRRACRATATPTASSTPARPSS